MLGKCSGFGIVAMILAGYTAAPTLVDRPPAERPNRFDARGILALSDVDMAGTAYADGVLKPVPDQTDTLAAILPDALTTVASTVPASSSVMGWPGAVEASPDGRFAYVIATKDPAPRNVERYAQGVFDGMPDGNTLKAIALTDLRALTSLGEIEVPAAPTSVQVSPDGRFALVSARSLSAPLVAVTLEEGVPTRVTPLPLTLPITTDRRDDQGVIYVRLAPDGRTVALNIANTHVQFGRLEPGADGRPVGVTLIGAAVEVGRTLSVLRWSSDSRHVIAANVAWGPSNLGAAINGPGSLVALRFDADGSHAVASRVSVSLSPEGFDINRAGDLLAVVNMERTYLPDALPYSLFGRRARPSLSLVSFDAATGKLTVVDGPVAFDGVLPEDAVFDDDGDMIAVAVFHDREARPTQGWVQWFAVDRSDGQPRARPLAARTPAPRGVHDLVVLPQLAPPQTP